MIEKITATAVGISRATFLSEAVRKKSSTTEPRTKTRLLFSKTDRSV